MKTLKRIAKVLGLILLIIALYICGRLAWNYYSNYTAMESLNDTVLGIEINAGDLEASTSLGQGQIHSKSIIKLSTILPLWENVSENGILKNEYKHLSNINFYVMTYKSDDLLVNGIIAEPKKEGKYPTIIFNRGGNKEVGKASKAKTLYSLIYSSSKLVDAGYVVVASCYREKDEFGGADINDVLNLQETIKEIEKADSSRIGMFGWSRGGMMTYLALKKSRFIKTAVIGNGPTDLTSLIIDRPEMESEVCAVLIPNYENAKQQALENRSVSYWADQLDKNSNLLILCGTEDQRVNPKQAVNFAKHLDAIQYNYTLETFETDHKFSNKRDELNELLINWFNEEL